MLFRLLGFFLHAITTIVYSVCLLYQHATGMLYDIQNTKEWNSMERDNAINHQLKFATSENVNFPLRNTITDIIGKCHVCIFH